MPVRKTNRPTRLKRMCARGLALALALGVSSTSGAQDFPSVDAAQVERSRTLARQTPQRPAPDASDDDEANTPSPGHRVLRRLNRAPEPGSPDAVPSPRSAEVIFSSASRDVALEADAHDEAEDHDHDHDDEDDEGVSARTLTRAAEPDDEPSEVAAETPLEPFVLPEHFVFQKPVRAGRLTSRYGMRRDPVRSKKRKRRRKMHKGIDYAAPTGTPIYTTGPGKVLQAGQGSKPNGLCVFIQHPNGWVSIYLHMSKVEVKPGQLVRPGQRIGRIGSTGRSTGPHLHFQIERNKQAVDPLTLLGKRSDKGKAP